MRNLFTKLRTLGHFLRQHTRDKIAAQRGRSRCETSPEKRLVIVKTDAIGDFVLWLPYARRLCNLFHDYEPILVCNNLVADLATAEGLFSRVLPIAVKRFEIDKYYRAKVIQQISALGCGVAIYPVFSRRFWTGDTLVRAAGAARAIGMDGDNSNLRPWQRWLSDKWYTDQVDTSSAGPSEIEKTVAFLRGLGDTDAAEAIGPLPIYSPSSAFSITGPYLVVAPGAGSERRMWPVERFAEVADKISIKYKCRVVVCGAPSEVKMSNYLMDQMCCTEKINVTGRTSLPELVELIRGARLIIANESSTAHIAATVRTPVVSILGGGHFRRFLPYPSDLASTWSVPVFKAMNCFGCNWQCTRPHTSSGPFECIREVHVEAVLGAVEQLLSNERAYENA